ncbi:MAG: DUF2442 domain-containing protein [Candidatus Limiplasma sp.]|nr:DUF2442 domain-containing protein [Candidatus Limiplasma sp.]
MLRPTAKTVVPMKDYMLRVSFDNGKTKDFDVKPYIRGNWYGELANPAYFKSVSANGYTVEWADGQDICPDELYYNSVAVHPA